MRVRFGAARWRRVTQFFSLAALNSRFLPVSTGRFCLPLMNCEGCALAWFACPVGVLREALVFRSFPWIAVGGFVLAGLLAGRVFCGWVCPAGLAQDGLYRIPSRKFETPRWTRGIKYAVLFLGVAGAAWFLGKESRLFFCNYCPVAAIQVSLPVMIADRDWAFDAGRSLRFGALALVLGLSVGQSRAFCKLFCPVGAAMGLAARLSRLRLRLRPDRCIECSRCDRACPAQVPVMAASGNILNRPECLGCFECRAACPVRALELGYRPGLARSDSSHFCEEHGTH